MEQLEIQVLIPFYSLSVMIDCGVRSRVLFQFLLARFRQHSQL